MYKIKNPFLYYECIVLFYIQCNCFNDKYFQNSFLHKFRELILHVSVRFAYWSLNSCWRYDGHDAHMFFGCIFFYYLFLSFNLIGMYVVCSSDCYYQGDVTAQCTCSEDIYVKKPVKLVQIYGPWCGNWRVFYIKNHVPTIYSLDGCKWRFGNGVCSKYIIIFMSDRAQLNVRKGCTHIHVVDLLLFTFEMGPNRFLI